MMEYGDGTKMRRGFWMDGWIDGWMDGIFVMDEYG